MVFEERYSNLVHYFADYGASLKAVMVDSNDSHFPEASVTDYTEF